MEFKEVAHYYLGSGLNISGSSDIFKLEGITNKKYILFNGLHTISIDKDDFIIDYSPLLRPLSQLTEEIEHNGERFVPIDRIKKQLLVDYELKTGDGVISLKSPTYTYLLFIGDEIVDECPFGVFKLLVSWHFNVFNIKDYIELK